MCVLLKRLCEPAATVALVILRRHHNHRRQSWGLGVATPRLWPGGRGRIVKYYYILSCTGSIFESGDF